MLILFGGFEQIIAQGISLITTVPTALTAAVTKIRKNKESIKNGVYVGIFGVSGSILGGNFAFNIPENILNITSKSAVYFGLAVYWCVIIAGTLFNIT